MDFEERKIKEIEHSDHRRSIVKGFEYHTDAESDDVLGAVVDSEAYEENFSNMKFYSITKSSFDYRDAMLLDGIKGAVALDYCCGNGEVALEMAKKGAAKVYGIDISSVAIENAKELARAAGVGDTCEFSVMDAENTTFGDETFDVIHEYGALHHLDLPSAFAELSRIIKKDGKLVCTEAIRHNPIIHWYRTRTPQLRTEWEVEHILGFPEIKSGRKYFDKINHRSFHLVGLAAVPFRKMFFFKVLLGLFNLIDRVLLVLPYLRRMAWIAVVVYKHPKK